MGATKSEIFSKEQNALSVVFKALGHPARVAIVQQLIKVNACVCNDFVAELGLAQPTVSQHLKELKNAGLIKGTIEGASVCYCLDKEGWEKVSSMFTEFNFNIHEINKCC